MTSPQTTAVVLIRHSSGGNIDFRPVRIYLVLVPRDENGAPVVPPRVNTKRPGFAYRGENAKATRRMGRLYRKASELADAINAGVMTFNAATEAYLAFDKYARG